MYLYYMKRRDFLRTSFAGLSSPLVLAKSTNLKINKNIIILYLYNDIKKRMEEMVKR